MNYLLPKKVLFNIGITEASLEDILKYIFTSLEIPSEKYFIVTPNPEIIIYSKTHSGYQTILNQARIAVCDGVGVFLASKFLGKSIKYRVTGMDLIENLCNESAKKAVTVGFLGGRNSVADRCAERLILQYPGLKVIFIAEEWQMNESGKWEIKNPSMNTELTYGKEHTSHPTIDLLFVAFGFPKQEEWLAENLQKLPIKVGIGVGGAFDYISEDIPRAPRILQKSGLEWFYRLIKQPWRWKRQRSLLTFFLLVLQQKFGKNT